jgi:hypothetical protein
MLRNRAYASWRTYGDADCSCLFGFTGFRGRVRVLPRNTFRVLRHNRCGAPVALWAMDAMGVYCRVNLTVPCCKPRSIPSGSVTKPNPWGLHASNRGERTSEISCWAGTRQCRASSYIFFGPGLWAPGLSTLLRRQRRNWLTQRYRFRVVAIVGLRR